MNLDILKNVYIPHMNMYEKDTQNELLRVLSRTTHLCVAAHPDDVEIMAFSGISECYNSDLNFFTAVIVTNGLGGEKSGIYKDFSDTDFINVRTFEQKNASIIGKYNAVVFLEYSSTNTKDKTFSPIDKSLQDIINLTKPNTIFTHNPFDFHSTHVAVLSRVIKALSNIEKLICPKVLGCEVWGSLDWLPKKRKVLLDVSENISLQEKLIEVFDSQIARGKDFVSATIGRRRANATFSQTLKEDRYKGITIAILLNEIIEQNMLLEAFVDKVLHEFLLETKSRLFSTIN